MTDYTSSEIAVKYQSKTLITHNTTFKHQLSMPYTSCALLNLYSAASNNISQQYNGPE